MQNWKIEIWKVQVVKMWLTNKAPPLSPTLSGKLAQQLAHSGMATVSLGNQFKRALLQRECQKHAGRTSPSIMSNPSGCFLARYRSQGNQTDAT